MTNVNSSSTTRPRAARSCLSARFIPPSMNRPISGSTWTANGCAGANTAASWPIAGSRSWPSPCSATTTSRSWPSASAASAAACIMSPTRRPWKAPPPCRPLRARSICAPSCWNWSGCTAISSGSGWPATSSVLTLCSCNASAFANRSCGWPRKSPATAKPTACASSAACGGT